jgi:uncharacterized repeat protein (TIGR02543 family)
MASNLLPSTSRSYTTTPLSNSAAGQTAVKVHYLDRSGNNITSVNVNYGWPVGTPDETPSSPVAAAPQTIARHQLITDNAILATTATALGIDPSQVLTQNASIDFPTSGTTDIYYIYAPIYEVSFDTNGSGEVPAQDVTQTDGHQAAVEPAEPSRSGYVFAGWFTDADFSTEYDFTAPVTWDVVLHAKWLKVCAWNPDLLDGDQACYEPCRHDPNLTATDPLCTAPDPDDEAVTTRPIVPAAPNTSRL